MRDSIYIRLSDGGSVPKNKQNKTSEQGQKARAKQLVIVRPANKDSNAVSPRANRAKARRIGCAGGNE